MSYSYLWVDAHDERALNNLGEDGWRIVPGSFVAHKQGPEVLRVLMERQEPQTYHFTGR